MIDRDQWLHGVTPTLGQGGHPWKKQFGIWGCILVWTEAADDYMLSIGEGEYLNQEKLAANNQSIKLIISSFTLPVNQ